MSSTMNGRLVPPLTFRLYQCIRFNRPVKNTDSVSPGGYEILMKDEDGSEKHIRFDFEDFEGSIDENNLCIVNCMQKNPDYNVFPDLNTVTEHMLRNITEILEWFVYTESDDNDEPLIPVEVMNTTFEIITDYRGGQISPIYIPITIPIKLASNCTFPITDGQKVKEMTKERCMELLNGIVDHVSSANNTSKTLRKLLSMGFTAEELINNFNFSEDEVEDSVKELEEEEE